VKFVASAASLASALSLAGAAVRGNKNAATVHMVADDGGTVSITATGSAISISASVKADVIEAGQAALAADRLVGLAAGFPPTARLTISAGSEGSMAMIVCGSSRSRVPLLDDLPQALALDLETDRVEISGSDLLTLLQPLAAADNELSRYYLSGVHWCSIAGKLTATATNGGHLIRMAVEADRFTEAKGLILPRESGAALARIVKATKPAKVTLRASERLLAVEGDAFSFTSLLIDYAYPDMSRVIPQPSANYVICNGGDLLATIQRLVAVASTEAPLIALSFDGAPSLHVFLARQSADGSDAIAAETTGSARVYVSPSQFAGMLMQFEGTVRIEPNGEQPVAIRDDDDKLALVMPCKSTFNDKDQAK
jgi:DNA polymerase III sliding clamp (beta) subunit (PCNA family)